MKNPDAYALLVGVGSYRAFDPSGHADLKGPINDVRGWWHIARDLGIPPENIMICADPAPAADTLGPGGQQATITGATRAELVDGLKWLASKLDGEDGHKALLTWSSHGTRTPQGQVLCPSDITADGTALDNGLAVSAVSALLAERAPHTRITALIDTCHNSTGFDDPDIVSRGLPWAKATPASARAASEVGHHAFGNLVVTSSEPGTVSYEISAVGAVRGAFSWSAANLIHRWGLAHAAGGATAGITYATLAERTGIMLHGLAVDQKPKYVGDPELAQARVFSSFGDGQVGDAPPQELGRSEIWPGVPTGKVYSASITAGGETYTLYLTGASAPEGWDNTTQYWDWSGDGWPSSDFAVAKPGNVSSPGTPPSTADTYSLGTLTAETGCYTVPAGSWEVQEWVSKAKAWSTIGYLVEATSGLTIYSVQSSPGSTLITSQQKLNFKYVSSDTDISYSAKATDS